MWVVFCFAILRFLKLPWKCFSSVRTEIADAPDFS